MISCKFCQNTEVVKHGLKNGFQRHLCKACRHSFIDNGVEFQECENKAGIIVTAMNLYFEGISALKAQGQRRVENSQVNLR